MREGEREEGRRGGRKEGKGEGESERWKERNRLTILSLQTMPRYLVLLTKRNLLVCTLH